MTFEKKSRCPKCSYAHAIGNQTTCDLKRGMPISPADWEWLNCRDFDEAAKVAPARIAKCKSVSQTSPAVEVERGDTLGSIFLKCGTFAVAAQPEEEEDWI